MPILLKGFDTDNNKPVAVEVDLTPGGSGGIWEDGSTVTASASSALEFTGFSSSYLAYEFWLEDILLTTDAQDLLIQVSTDNGSTWKTGATDYSWAALGRVDVGIGDAQSSGDDSINLGASSALGNAAGEDGICGVVKCVRPTNSTKTKILFETVLLDNLSGRLYAVYGAGHYETAGAVNAIRFLSSSGTIASGSIHEKKLIDNS